VTSVIVRFLHIALAAFLVLTTKASDDPIHDNSGSENPTGRAAVHGHPKVAAGFRWHDKIEDINDVS